MFAADASPALERTRSPSRSLHHGSLRDLEQKQLRDRGRGPFAFWLTAVGCWTCLLSTDVAAGAHSGAARLRREEPRNHVAQKSIDEIHESASTPTSIVDAADDEHEIESSEHHRINTSVSELKATTATGLFQGKERHQQSIHSSTAATSTQHQQEGQESRGSTKKVEVASNSNTFSASHSYNKNPGDVSARDVGVKSVQLPVLPPWREPADSLEDAVWVRRAVEQYNEQVRFDSTTASASRSRSASSSDLEATGTAKESLLTTQQTADLEAEEVKKDGVFLFAVWTSLGTQKRMRASLDTWMKSLGPQQAVMITSAFPTQQEENQKLIREKVGKGELKPQVFAPVAGHCRDRLSRRLNFPGLTWNGMADYELRNMVHLCSLPFVFQVAARIPNLTFLATTEDDAYVLPQPYQLRAEDAFANPAKSEFAVGDQFFRGNLEDLQERPKHSMMQQIVIGEEGATTSTFADNNPSSSTPAVEEDKKTSPANRINLEVDKRREEEDETNTSFLATMGEGHEVDTTRFPASTWRATDPMAMAWWSCGEGLCGQNGSLYNAAAVKVLGAAVSHEHILSHVGRWAAAKYAKMQAQEAALAQKKKEKTSDIEGSKETVHGRLDDLTKALMQLQKDFKSKANVVGDADSGKAAVEQLEAIAKSMSELATIIKTKKFQSQTTPKSEAKVDAGAAASLVANRLNATKSPSSSGSAKHDEATTSPSQQHAASSSGLNMGHMPGMGPIVGWVLKDLARSHVLRLLWQPPYFVKAQVGYSDFAKTAALEPREKTVVFHYIADPWKPGKNSAQPKNWPDHYAAHRELRDHMRANHDADEETKKEGKNGDGKKEEENTIKTLKPERKK